MSPNTFKSTTNFRMKVDVLVPGFKKSELKVRTKNDDCCDGSGVISIKGSPKSCDKSFGYSKCPFKTNIPVSKDFDLGAIEVGLSRGILSVSVPRTDSSKGEVIGISSGRSNPAPEEDTAQAEETEEAE